MKRIITLIITLFIIQATAQESASLKITSHTTEGESDPKRPLVEISYQGEKVNLGRFANLNDVKPEWISSINVLKGQSATAIYGKDGEDGVIMIQLKSSPEIKAYFEKEASVYRKLTRIDEYQDASQRTFEEDKTELTSKKAKIKIREDINYLDNPPLIILKLDDEQLELNEIKNIDKLDTDLIEEIKVFKDQKSLKLFDAEEKPGVILVKMKSGRKSAKQFKKLQKALEKNRPF